MFNQSWYKLKKKINLKDSSKMSIQSCSAEEIINRVIGDHVRQEFTRMLSEAGKLTPEFVKEISTVDYKVGISDQLYKQLQESEKISEKISEKVTEKVIEPVKMPEKVTEKVKMPEKVTESIKLKKPRKVKSPKEPKKPLTSYMLFCKDKRAELKALHPNMKFAELSKVMGFEWKSLSLAEKHKYAMKAVDDRTRYSDEMKDYIRPSNQELVEERQTRKRSIGTSKGVKRPVSSYMFFSKDKSQEIKNANPEMTLKELHSELGRLWREVFNTDQVREKWVKLAEADRTRYYREKTKALSQDENGKGEASKKRCN